MFGPVFKGKKKYFFPWMHSVPKKLGMSQEGICLFTDISGGGRNSVSGAIAIL